MLLNDLKHIAKSLSAEMKEKKGVYTLERIVAERKVLLSRKKLTYRAKFRIDEDRKELRFTEMLQESGSGMSTGDSEFGPGFGFRKEIYKVGAGPREGTIEGQSTLFGKQYTYTFDFAQVRSSFQDAAAKDGYGFKYQVTPVGL